MDMQERPFDFGDGNKPFNIPKNVQSEEPANNLSNDSTIAKEKPNTATFVSSDAGNKIEKRKPKSPLKLLVKKSKIQNSQNFTLETIFDRFPTISDYIFERLDEESFANCVEVNRMWQTVIANQKVYLKKKIYNWSKHCKQSSHSG